MNAWVFRRGEWEPRAMPATRPPAGFGVTSGPQSLTPDASVNLYVGGDAAEFPYVVSMRFGHEDLRRREWICIPDLPSLLQLTDLLAPFLRNEVAVQSYMTALLDERLGPPPDRPAGTGSARDLTAMNQVLYNDATISADLDRVAHMVADNTTAAGAFIDNLVRDLGNIRAEITTEGDPNGMRFDAVITLLQSASLLLQSGEQDSAVAEAKKALSAWKLDGTESLLP